MMNALLRVLIVAAVATIGDFIWYTYGVRHSFVAGPTQRRCHPAS